MASNTPAWQRQREHRPAFAGPRRCPARRHGRPVAAVATGRRLL